MNTLLEWRQPRSQCLVGVGIQLFKGNAKDALLANFSYASAKEPIYRLRKMIGLIR